MTAAPAPTTRTTDDVAKSSVVLIDDHPIVRQGLAQLLNDAPDLNVVAEAATPEEALDVLERAKPDIAIVDVSLQGRSGIELTKEIRERFPQTAVLVLSMHDESLHAERALRAGAKGYIMKQEATDKLLVAIRKVLAGEIYVSDTMASRMLQQVTGARPGQAIRNPLDRLTDREMEVFTMIGQGVGTRDIATKLGLSVKTVEAHREHIKDKLNLDSGRELMRYAMQHVMNGA
jgi:DNA-binding NarL/FixJ family response regulator